MKALLLCRYSANGASSRMRVLQYLPYLERAGIDAEVRSFFDPEYLDALYAGKRLGIGATSQFYRQRISTLRQAQADVIWLEKEAFPYFPWPIETVFWPSTIPVVSDYDDAIFHRYDDHRRALVRRALGRKIDAVMAASRIVTAGNDYLASRARSAGATDVRVVPTVVDLARYDAIAPDRENDEVRIGWIGTPLTWIDYGRPVLAPLAPFVESQNARLVAIGAAREERSEAGIRLLPWSAASEVELLRGLDIGVMPLQATPWEKGKCAYKLIQYMACGLPVVASPVGMNCEVVRHGENGFLASTQAEWRDAIQLLLADPELRRKMGQEGRKDVEQHYSLQTWGPRVAQILADAASGG